MANLASFFILSIFLFGRSLAKKNLKWHIRLMSFAFAADVLLILALVFGRHALSKVNGDMSIPLMIHVPIAVSTVILYVLTVKAGYDLYQGRPTRERLKTLDKILTTLRILTFVTSVWVQVSGL